MGNQIDTLSQEIVTQINTVKSGLADAITEKGVETASNATFATMQTNIANIPAGGGLNPGDEISAQNLTIPQPIWQSPDYLRSNITALFKDIDGYVYKDDSPNIRKINLNGTVAWTRPLYSSDTVRWIIKDGENYVFQHGYYLYKVNVTTGFDVVSPNLALSSSYIGFVDTDGYLIASGPNVIKIKLDLTGKFQANLKIDNNGAYSALFDSVHDVFVFGCYGNLITVNRAATAKVIDFSVGNNIIYSLIDDGTGYVCGSRNNLTKVKYDGSGKVFDYDIAHGTISKIILESDGYVCLSTSGYVTKISLDGTLMWDTDLSIYGSSTNYLVKADNGYYTTTGSDNLVKLDYAGNIIMGCYIGNNNKATTSSYLSNGFNSDIIVESDGLILPSTCGRLTKYPFDPKYTYNS